MSMFRMEKEMLRIRDIKWGESQHPIIVVGRAVFLICLLFIVAAALTGFIPSSIQPFAIAAVSVIMILAVGLSFWGTLKSFDSSAYPVFLVVITITLVVMIIWILGLPS